ncbi:MAG: C-GCAxxG-C-C family protein [Desulfuromonadales bacterium]|jgi:C_GCAxxG_C_C family probable redox protein
MLKFFRRKTKRNTQENTNAREEAGRLFAAGQNCAQAVLQATTGIDDPQMLKMAKAFGGGVGGSKCLCGAVSGGVMALGLREKGHLADRLVDEFRQAQGATCCIALSRKFRWNSKEHKANCRLITEETAETVARLLEK